MKLTVIRKQYYYFHYRLADNCFAKLLWRVLMAMDKADLIKFRNRNNAEIRSQNKKGIAKVICFACGEDNTQRQCRCNSDLTGKDKTKMMSLTDSIFQHLTGFPVM